jgi:hypothetical protein
MRTRSGATKDTPSSSYGRQPTPPPPNPPPAPTLADAIASLINISADNAHLLQAIAQDRIPAQQDNRNPPGNNNYADFLKT